MTLKALRAEMKRWQAKLGMQHWRIKLVWGVPVTNNPEPFSDELTEDCVGHSWFCPESPNAVISISRGQGVHTLVHELLHILLEGHRPHSGRYDPQYERAINHLTDTLIGKPDLTI